MLVFWLCLCGEAWGVSSGDRLLGTARAAKERGANVSPEADPENFLATGRAIGLASAVRWANEGLTRGEGMLKLARRSRRGRPSKSRRHVRWRWRGSARAGSAREEAERRDVSPFSNQPGVGDGTGCREEETINHCGVCAFGQRGPTSSCLGACSTSWGSACTEISACKSGPERGVQMKLPAPRMQPRPKNPVPAGCCCLGRNRIEQCPCEGADVRACEGVRQGRVCAALPARVCSG